MGETKMAKEQFRFRTSLELWFVSKPKLVQTADIHRFLQKLSTLHSQWQTTACPSFTGPECQPDLCISPRCWEIFEIHLQTNKVIKFDNLRTRIFIKFWLQIQNQRPWNCSEKVLPYFSYAFVGWPNFWAFSTHQKVFQISDPWINSVPFMTLM